jgi:hypothetical protein
LQVPAPQVVDPAVSRAKFDREITAYRKMEASYRKRGWLLLDVDFPEVCVAFGVPKLRPFPIVAAVVIDFTDYDLRPLSVRFVNPFTREPLVARNLNFSMLRRSSMPPEAFAAMLQQGTLPVTNIVQFNDLDDHPYICLPGVREYHDNPAHTGDSWLLHRVCGEGSLAFILDKIGAYGVDPLSAFQIQAQATTLALGANPQAFQE